MCGMGGGDINDATHTSITDASRCSGMDNNVSANIAGDTYTFTINCISTTTPSPLLIPPPSPSIPNMGFIMLITVMAVIAMVLAVILARELGRHY